MASTAPISQPQAYNPTPAPAAGPQAAVGPEANFPAPNAGAPMFGSLANLNRDTVSFGAGLQGNNGTEGGPSVTAPTASPLFGTGIPGVATAAPQAAPMFGCAADEPFAPQFGGKLNLQA